MNRPRWALGMVSLVISAAVMSLGYACSTSSGVTPSPACASLATCCTTVPAAQQSACAEAAGTENEVECTDLLTTYTAANECSTSGLTLPDGGTVTINFDAANGSCAALATCCKSVPSVEQASCDSVVTLGSATSCATTLSGLTESGECAGGGVGGSDAGGTTISTLSGPSCPAGSPPESFVGADASADCVKCANNCLSTEGFTDDCAQYYDCFCPCAADDTGCQQACAPLAGDCPETTTDVGSCIKNDCASLCTTPSSGTVGCVVPGGGFGDQIDAGNACGEAIFGDAGPPGGSCSALASNATLGTCPTANLVGCCVESESFGTIVECYYPPNVASQEQASCQGTWTTTLP